MSAQDAYIGVSVLGVLGGHLSGVRLLLLALGLALLGALSLARCTLLLLSRSCSYTSI